MVMTPIEKMYLLFLFLAYSAVMVVMFGFIMRMLKKGRQLEEDVRRLKNAWEGHEMPTGDLPGMVAPNVQRREFGQS